jgi:hypothetical protein
MLISDIATIVQNSIGDRGGIMARPDLVIFWVNEAVLDIYRQTDTGRESPTSFVLPVGASSYDPFVTGSKQILKMHYMHNGSFEMEEASIDNLLDWYGVDYFTNPGTPRYYYKLFVAGHTALGFAPVGDKDFTIIYSASFTPPKFTLVSNDTSTLIPSSYDSDVIRFCIMRAHELEKDFQAADVARTNYDKNMFTRADESHSLDDGYSRITADEYDFL